jgi:hypothetical protein
LANKELLHIPHFLTHFFRFKSSSGYSVHSRLNTAPDPSLFSQNRILITVSPLSGSALQAIRFPMAELLI